jgi:hypothetical protein
MIHKCSCYLSHFMWFSFSLSCVVMMKVYPSWPLSEDRYIPREIMLRRMKDINHLTSFCVALFLIHIIWEQVPNSWYVALTYQGSPFLGRSVPTIPRGNLGAWPGLPRRGDKTSPRLPVVPHARPVNRSPLLLPPRASLAPQNHRRYQCWARRRHLEPSASPVLREGVQGLRLALLMLARDRTRHWINCVVGKCSSESANHRGFNRVVDLPRHPSIAGKK